MTSISEIMSNVSQLDEAKQNLRKLLKESGAEQVIAKAFQEVLVDCPDVCVSWCQYAPSFNDGAACVFLVHDMWICPVDSDCDESSSVDPGTGKCYDSNDKLGDQIYCTPEQQQKLNEIWNGVNDEFVMDTLFGSRAKVIITADNIEVDRYYDGGY